MPKALTNKNGSAGEGGETGEAGAASLNARLREHYPSLPESERKVADFIFDGPGELAAYSATEIAEAAGASKAAVSRLIRRLGYANFEEVRRTIRDNRKVGSPYFLMNRDGGKKGSFGQVVADQIAQDMASINLTLEGIYKETFDQIVDAIVSAKRIWIVGFRNGHYLAGYLRWQLIQMRGGVHSIQAAGETLAEYLADFQAGDLVIVMGFRRRVKEIDLILRAAGRSEARSLLIADLLAPETLKADWSIRCEIRGSDIFDRYTGVMSFLHFLSIAVARATGGKGRRHLQRIEELHEEFDDFG